VIKRSAISTGKLCRF